VRLNEKDVKDTLVLLREHDIADTDEESINASYIAKLMSQDWGFYYTLTTNLVKVKNSLASYPILSEDDQTDIASKIDRLLDRIESEPKSMGWKMRARVGSKKKWYNDVERTEGACGRDPISTGMMIAKELGLKPEILHYAHSGDVTGDTTQVVGYGSIVWTGDVEKKKPTVDSTGSMDVPKDVRKKMLVYVRKAITEYVVNGKRLKIEDKEPIWDEKVGLFVTLKKNEDLRGCIGFIEGVATLRETLVEMAISASTKDPRFESVTKDEIDNLSIEISVLSPLYLVKDIDEIKVGRDGLIIKRGFYQGLLLPQVATEYNWNREEFLSHTCEKAGLPRDAWKDKKSEIRRFSATVFSEESEGITR